jgi:hypothetical protein
MPSQAVRNVRSLQLDRDVWERDRPRQNRLELLGWTILRFSWRTLVERPS